MNPTLALQILAILGAFVAMVTDSRTGKIPNVLTFPMMAVGLTLNGWLFGLSGAGYSLLALLLGICFYLPFAAIGAFGMGDVKLLAGIGALCGVRFVVTTFLYTSIIGIPHVLVIQYLNHGKNALQLLLTSYTTGAFKDKTIFTDNREVRYHYYLGLDIFLGTRAATIVPLPISW